VLDFGALPPEINSARIYAGPGSTSLQAAASAWNAIAAEMSSAATAYSNVVTQLASEEWLGPASTSMANAAGQYVSWMGTTAAQAEQTAILARTAAAAYEQALMSSVPPPAIAVNRAETAQLVATNVLGQNTPAIAQLEAQYGQMWAQDAAAMYTYAGQSAVATKVPTVTAPTTVADPAPQAAAVTAATGSSTSTGVQSTLAKVTSATPTALQSLATPATTTTDPSFLSDFWSSSNPLFNNPIFHFLFGTAAPSSLAGLVNLYSPYAGFFYNTEGLPYFSVGMGNSGIQMAKTLGLIGAPAAAGGAAKGAVGGLGGLGGLLGGGGGVGGHVSAGLGSAGAVGKLAVPPAWGGASAALPATSAPLPISSVAAAPEATGGAGNLLGGMPLAGAGAGGAGGAAPRYGFRPTVMARPPFAG
jgi:PPE-repeat protein